MKNINTSALTALAISSVLALSACGGGGGGGGGGSSTSGSNGASTTPPASPTLVTGTLTTPQYPANSAQLAAFNLLNQYRTECGFPALQENTLLDTAAQNHAKYMGLNNVLSDTEVSGNPGFTGATYVDRAASVGFPSSAYGPGVSVETSTTTGNFSSTQYAQQSMYSLLGGVYHADIAAYPSNTVGVGEYETQVTSGGHQFTNSWLSLSLLNTQAQPLSAGPLTFPCQGVTGLPYREVSEIPTPPNVSASGWGTPVVVMGNVSDTVVLQSVSVSGPSGQVAVQTLNATTDPNKELAAYQAVAYPTSPLSPNTQYSVSLTGTVNGTPFSRSFTFTTGNVVG